MSRYPETWTKTTSQTPDLIQALCSQWDEAHRLIDELAAKVDSVDPERADWGDVGTLTHIVERLREAVGER